MLRQAAAIVVFTAACAHPPAQTAAPEPAKPVAPTAASVATPPAQTPKALQQRVDFAQDVRPILESRCQPCHFPGGRMYDRLPFDRPETIRQLGVKLFTRIKDESSQATIRHFLEPAQ
jgi:hypothetical protein